MRQALALLLCLAGGALFAADDPARAQLEQRIQLTARLIADSPTAQRITSSGHVQAIAHYEEGRLHQQLAEEMLGRGDLAAARREVDEALRHVATARRLVPDMQARQAAARQRYGRQRTELERLIDAWQRHPGPAGSVDGDLVDALGLIGTATAFADAGRFEDAGYALDLAQSHVLVGMNRALQAQTLDYTARPANPAEEFELELARHQGLAELLPLALNELKPRPDAAALIDRYGKTSQTLRGEALQRFQRGDTPQALADLRNAILFVQRALAAAGVSTPEATGSPP